MFAPRHIPPLGVRHALLLLCLALSAPLTADAGTGPAGTQAGDTQEAIAGGAADLAAGGTADLAAGGTSDLAAGGAADLAAGGAAGGRTALLVFLDYEDNVSPPVSPTALRLAATETLTGKLDAAGRSVLTYPEIEPAMRAWGVRSPLDLPLDFLHTLGSEYSVDDLMVARIVLYRDRVLLLARGLERRTGHLYWADVTEAPIDAEFWAPASDTIALWKSLVGRMGADLETRWSMEPSEIDGPTLVMLPLQSTGLAEQTAELASHSLLGALLAARRYQIPDPAIVRTVLRSKGYDPLLLGRAGREELVTWFAPSSLIDPKLVTFASRGAAGFPQAEQFGDDDVPSPVSASSSSLYLQVLTIDCETGQARAAEAVYLEPDDPVGLFGVLRQIPVARRFEDGARRIVRNLLARGGSI